MPQDGTALQDCQRTEGLQLPFTPTELLVKELKMQSKFFGPLLQVSSLIWRAPLQRAGI